MLDEGVEEFVVEGLVPGLAGEHCAEVRAALAHDRLEADHGGAFGGHRHVLGCCREPDDVRPVVGEDGLVPCDAQLQFRIGEPHTHQHLHRPRAVVVIRDGLEVLVKRLDCYGFTLSCKRADRPHLVLVYLCCAKRKGSPVVFHRQPPAVERLALALGGTPVHLEGFDDGRGGSYLQELEQLMLNKYRIVMNHSKWLRIKTCVKIMQVCLACHKSL